MIDPKLSKDIHEIVRKHYVAAAAAIFGIDAIAPEDWDAVEAIGLIPYPDEHTPIMDDLHHHGSRIASNPSTPFTASIKQARRTRIPRTDIERNASEWVRQHGAQWMMDLGSRAGHQAANIAAQQSDVLHASLKDAAQAALGARFGDADAQAALEQMGADAGLSADFFDDQFRSSIRQTASNIGHAMQDWTRDIQRVATTMGHNAVNDGIRSTWEAEEEKAAKAEKRPIRKILAYKLPRPDACKHCIRLHLEADNPRLYWLDELAGNGTNVGKRADDWNAVIGTTHPWCGCTLHRVPFVLVNRVTSLKGWRSGQAAPSVVGPGGSIT